MIFDRVPRGNVEKGPNIYSFKELVAKSPPKPPRPPLTQQSISPISFTRVARPACPKAYLERTLSSTA